MHSLRDHLLKAGLVTKEQAAKAESEKNGKKKKRRPPKKNGHDSQGTSSSNGSNGKPKTHVPNRMLDLSDPQRLKIQQAIESHKVRGDTKGEIAFNFTLRDGRIRKMFVSKEMQAGLENGNLAIVENGEAESHIIVSSQALTVINDVDRDAVRFHNAN
jgi:uncharacterized protein YaiL (DUF2058 family)